MRGVSPGSPAGRVWRALRSDPWLAVALGACTLAYSAIGVDKPSIWADEGATLSATGRSWPDLWRLVHNIDAVHGAYYAIMKVWLALVGTDAVSLRVPSLVAVGITAFLTYLLARTWLNAPQAVIATVVFATLPRSTWMAIEGRSWALGTLLGVAATLCLVRWEQNPRVRTLLGYGLVATCGIAANIYLVFLVAAHGVTLLLLKVGWDRGRQWLLAAAGSVAAASPIILQAIAERAQLGDREPLEFPGWIAGVFGRQFVIGDTAGEAATFVPRWLWTGSAMILAGLAWALVTYAIVSARRVPLPERSMALAWVLAWVALPPTIVLAFSLTGANLYHPRYFAFTAPAFAIAVAVGAAGLPQAWLRRLAVALLVAATVPVFVSQRDVYAKNGYDWSEVALRVSSTTKSLDGVYFAPAPPTRTIGIAYPAPFSRLTDLTLLTTPAADASLDGSSLPLEAKLLATAPDRVIAVWSVRSESQSADRALFAQAGYRELSSWLGPQTQLTVFQR